MANHNEVAHSWAHKQNTKTRGNSMFHERGVIYSYGHHFPIASHVVSPRTGKNLVMFTSQCYSVSTSKHISITRRAIPAGVQVLETANPAAYAKGYTAQIRRDIEKAAGDIKKLIEEASRARKNGPFILGHAQGVQDNALAIINHFAKGHDRRALRALLPSLQGLDLASIRKALAKQAKKDAAAKKERARLVAIKNAEVIEQWRAGDSVYIGGLRLEGDLIRLSACGLFLETSRSCKAPVSDCRVALALALRAIDAGKTMRPDSLRLGVYSVNSITPKGAQVGCHFFSAEELKRAAALVSVA